MKLENTFMVPVPVEDAWRILLDVDKIAPCLPGASVESVEGDEVVGRVKVKLGPIALTYRGMITFIERDEQERRVVMSAKAKEARGSGTADATITTALGTVDGQTQVSVVTDLKVTGKPAQFGRGVMQDVSGNLVEQFATSLARELESDSLAGRAAAPSAGAPTPGGGAQTAPVMPNRDESRRGSEAIDLLDIAGSSVAQRGVPVVAGILVGLVLGWMLGRRP
jgi:uncharacterized protein